MRKVFILGALLVVSCTKIVEYETVPAEEVKTIPYSVTISSDQTRATVDEDMKTIRYAAGDKLYLESETRDDVKGVLTLKSGDEGKTGAVTFEGNICYTGDALSEDLLLKATLVSSKNKGIQISDGKVTGIEYPSYQDYCTDVHAAVEEYSLLTGFGTLGARLFPLNQHTAFLSFTLNVEDADSEDANFTVYLNNGGNTFFLGSVVPSSEEQNCQLRFALPVPEGTVLENASVIIVQGKDFSGTPATRYAASFGGSEPKTLSPKVYRVTKTAVANTGLVETGLPIIEITTHDPTHGASYIAKHKNEEQPSWVEIHVGNKTIKPKTDKDDPNDLSTTNCSIKGRGNTTWSWAKKPYKLKLEKKTALLQEMGLTGVSAKSKHWVLLANYMDRTMMRNRIAMEISSMMTNLAWTPHCIPVELYINGVHQGNYLLIEQVRVEDGRVDVKNGVATPDDANDVGFMMELDYHFDNYYGDVSGDNTIQWRELHGTSKYANVPYYDSYHNGKSNKGIPFSIKEPEWSPKAGETPVNTDQLNYIKDYVAAAGATLFVKDKDSDYWYGKPSPNPDPDNGYPKYLDVASFIDYWIVFETMINHELGNPGSVYMTKPRNGKLTAGPCWDFDWGTLSDGYNNARKPNPTTNLMNEDALWYRSLMKDYSFVNQLYNRFCELRPQLETIPAKIDEWEREMAVSAELNFKMWDPMGAARSRNRTTINGDETLPYPDAVASIKRFYSERLSFIQEKLENLLKTLPQPSSN